MKTKQKNLLLAAVSAVFAISLFFGIGVKAAFADSSAPLDSVNLTMDVGASVRKNEPTGLRFRSLMSVSDYNALMESVGDEKTYASVSFGMLIAPEDYIAEYGALTAENVFGEDAKYSFGDTESEKPKIINVYGDAMKDEGGNKAFVGIMTNIKPQNYDRKFVGAGYIEAVDQSGAHSYKFATANDNARSVINVAQKAIEKGESDDGGVLADFTKYSALGGIVSDVWNGDKTARNAVDYKTGKISVTATESDLNIFLNRSVISENGEGYDYVRLYPKSENAAEFWLLPRAKGANDVTWSYMPGELGTEGFKTGGKTLKYVDIPLNDPSVHDFSQYDLRLRASTKGQNITIEKIEYISLAQNLLNADNWDDYDGVAKTENATENSITLRGWQFGISAAYIQKAIESGYTHLRFDYTLQNKSDSATSGIFMTGNNTNYAKYYSNQNIARFDLTELKKSDGAYANIWMQGRNAEAWAEAKDMSMTVTNPVLFKSAETAKWDKGGRNSIYCAEEENGFIVLDTVSAGNDAHVLSTTEWWKKYADNPAAANVSQRTVILSGKYLYAGGNNRGAVWGGAGSPVSVIGGTANTEIVTEYMNDVLYSEENKFYYGLDSEGVYALNISEFVSNRNVHGGFSFTYAGKNQFKISTPNDDAGFRLVNINTADYIAKGYKYFTITVSGATQPVWLSDGAGSKEIGFSGDQNWTKTIDLTDSQWNIDNGYLVIQFGKGEKDVIVTYDFFVQ